MLTTNKSRYWRNRQRVAKWYSAGGVAAGVAKTKERVKQGSRDKRRRAKFYTEKLLEKKRRHAPKPKAKPNVERERIDQRVAARRKRRGAK